MRLGLLIALMLLLLALSNVFGSDIVQANEPAQSGQANIQSPDAFEFDDAVKIGVLAYRGKDWTLNHWTATADYLNEKIKGYTFEIVPLSLSEMEFAVRNSELDFAVTTSGNYITLETRYGASRLVTLNALGPRTSENHTGAVIFTRADRSDIQNLSDLQDKSYMSVSRNAFCFEMGWYAMQQKGIDPFKDFRSLHFSGFPQDNIVMAVKEGRVDAGDIQTGLLESMAAEGKIKLSDFRILNPVHIDGFPYLTSTRVYPEWPFIKLKRANKALATKVAIALLSMPADSPAAREGEYAGWTVPLDYSSVQNMFRALHIGPYAGLGKLTLATFFDHYRPWIIMALLSLLISIAWAARTERVVSRRTAELAKANKDLADQIVQRRRAEDIARQRQAELFRVAEMNSMGELASGIAHELNHPLATIVNYATGCLRKLRSGNGSNDEMCDVLERMLNQANHASQVIKGLRNAIRENKRERKEIDINQVVHDVSDLLEFNLRNQAINLTLELADDLPLVNVDPIQIEQVLLNLTGNSIDALGTVEETKRTITIFTSSTDKELLVVVQDTGPGISKAIADKVFDPFVTTKKEGMGLGLAISCSIIKDHGGNLWLHGDGGAGTEFRFTLPLEEKDDRS